MFDSRNQKQFDRLSPQTDDNIVMQDMNIDPNKLLVSTTEMLCTPDPKETQKNVGKLQ